ncbi:hypothetical protein BpHYR1_033576 [Brachionus plicatilis]|uniref:Uncharacterized protein n=1 Tax=Brachionus plicatilis TaxID=10195 RepID=A0A3M7RY67_BRAPC|nr:hypothetical protein BpHYR1_033576 [Brachionus plicatilis]
MKIIKIFKIFYPILFCCYTISIIFSGTIQYLSDIQTWTSERKILDSVLGLDLRLVTFKQL